MCISIHAEKAIDGTQHPFMTKFMKRLEVERLYLNIIKDTCEKAIATTYIMEKMQSIQNTIMAGYPFSSFIQYRALIETLQEIMKREGNTKETDRERGSYLIFR